MEPYVVHEATGFGPKSVKRLDVIEPAILPDQFPVEFRVYVAFRFMKRPEETGMTPGVAMLATLRVCKLELPETVRDVRVPTDVIFPWAVWSWDAEKAPIVTFAVFRLLRADAFPMNRFEDEIP